jgi:hypothetical protein
LARSMRTPPVIQIWIKISWFKFFSQATATKAAATVREIFFYIFEFIFFYDELFKSFNLHVTSRRKSAQNKKITPHLWSIGMKLKTRSIILVWRASCGEWVNKVNEWMNEWMFSQSPVRCVLSVIAAISNTIFIVVVVVVWRRETHKSLLISFK